jgi:soluble lytic murein transglycosylase
MRKIAPAIFLFFLLFQSTTARAVSEDEADDEPAPEEPAPIRKKKLAPFPKQWLEPYFTQTRALRGATAFRAGDYAKAITELEAVLSKLKKDSPEYHPLRFLLAISHMNQSSWKTAGEIFESLYTRYPALAPYHAFYAARCQIRRNELDSALVWLSRIPSDSVLEAEAVMFKVDAFVSTKRWADVENETSSFISRFPRGARWPEALFRHAEAKETLGRGVEEIAAAYRKVWIEAPFDNFAVRAEERLEALAQANPPKRGIILAHSVEDQSTRGMIFFNANQNTQAESTFSTALAQRGVDPATQCSLRFHLAQSVWKQRQRTRAAPLFEQAISICRQAKEHDFTARSLYQGARSLASSGNKEKALTLYAQIEKDYPEHRLADDARLRAAEVFVDLNKKDDATAFLSNLADRYPKGDMAPEALWRLAFAAYQAKDWDKALDILTELLQRFPREDIFYAEGRALYFKARTLHFQGKKKEARATYERAIREYPLSAYALFSLERMRQAFPETRTAILRELRANMGHKTNAWNFQPNDLWDDPRFVRAVELARLGLGLEARRELARLGISGRKRTEARPEGQDDPLWVTALLLDRNHLWNASHAIPRYSIADFRRRYPIGGRPEAEWQLGFPRAFPEAVHKNSRTTQVPETLAWAIMREESAFFPRAESFANAQGLLQLMPRTAQRFAKYTVNREMLFDPNRNLELGFKFLDFLLDHFGGAAPLTISGYNAGEGAVDRWLKERGQLELDEFIETIPYDETRGYTKRVLSSYLTYAWLYSKERPVPQISFSLKKEEKKQIRPTPKKASTNVREKAVVRKLAKKRS